jgi:hypothetical protein
MLKLWMSRGIGRRGAAPMMPRWLRMLPPARVSNSKHSLVGDNLTGSVTGGSEPEVRVRGRNTAAGPCGGAAPGAVWAAPPPLFLSVKPPAKLTPAASAKPRENSQGIAGSSPPTTRKRVVLLPHAQIEPSDTEPTTAAHRDDQ